MAYDGTTMPNLALHFPLNSGKRIAVIVTGVIGTISSVSVSLLLLHLFTVSFISGRVNANKDERIFLRMHLGAFVVCLLISDLIQGVSGIMQLEWARRSAIDDGPLCTAQAAMLLFGDNGTAFWNASVAIHTFLTVVLRKRMSTVVVAFMIASGWTIGIFLAIIGPLAIETPERGPYYSIAGAWCFVTSNYSNERIYFHYIPMLLSGFVITVLYLLVALVLFGILVVDSSGWRFKSPTRARLLDCFGQISWNTRGTSISYSQSSSGLKSVSARIPTTSIRLGSISRRSNDIRPGEEPTATVHAIDITPPRPFRPDSGSPFTRSTDQTAPDAVEHGRGRSNDAKTLGGSRPIGLSKEGRMDVKIAPTAHGAQNSADTTRVSGRLHLKTLAVKMLWYPITYLVLVMPIAISRVDSSLKVSVSVMLGFMCLLWSMGAANTVIYIFTRRLGPTPWSRRNLSISRSRSMVSHHKKEPNSTSPVEIFVDRYTQRETDEQFQERARKKGVRSSLTGAEISSLDTMPAPSSAQKVGFDFDASPRHPTQPVTTHVVYPSSYPPYTHTRSPITSFSPASASPRSRLEARYEEPHPYSRARSPTSPHSHTHDVQMHYHTYCMEDDDDSMRTNSRRGSVPSNNIRQ